jgi:hypothetical protein
MSSRPEPVVEQPFHERVKYRSEKQSKKSVNLHRLPHSFECRQVIRLPGNLSNKGISSDCTEKKNDEQLISGPPLFLNSQCFALETWKGLGMRSASISRKISHLIEFNFGQSQIREGAL